MNKIIDRDYLFSVLKKHLPDWNLKLVKGFVDGSVGLCDYHDKEISIKYIGPRDISRGGMEYLYTMLHEIAHAQHECYCLPDRCEHWKSKIRILCEEYHIEEWRCMFTKSAAMFYNS
jgi:hypothetical protein